MAHYEDLSPCHYFHRLLRAKTLLAVGWLESGYPYTTGDPGPEVCYRLQEFTWRLAWQPVPEFIQPQEHLHSWTRCRLRRARRRYPLHLLP
jgi:hypothetical protein